MMIVIMTINRMILHQCVSGHTKASPSSQMETSAQHFFPQQVQRKKKSKSVNSLVQHWHHLSYIPHNSSASVAPPKKAISKRMLISHPLLKTRGSRESEGARGEARARRHGNLSLRRRHLDNLGPPFRESGGGGGGGGRLQQRFARARGPGMCFKGHLLFVIIITIIIIDINITVILIIVIILLFPFSLLLIVIDINY